MVGWASMAGAALAGEARPPSRITWPIPGVAWRLPIGRCEGGIPIGGFGAGSIMLNSGGSFGPWHFKVGFPELERRLAAAAFHFYEKPEGRPARVTTLSATRQMPGWSCLPVNSGFYHALYPKGWFTYRCFTADLSMKFFSPIIRGNVRETSYPVAIFEFAATNPTERPIDVALMLTFPNAAAHTADLRSGFLNFAEADRDEKIAAVVLDARYERNHPASQDAEWCVAVRAEKGGQVSYVPSWNAMSSGGDILAEFADDGRLPNKALDTTDCAAAVAFHTRLAPKATATVPFALSWDFPRVAFGGTLWWRRYAEYFERDSNNAFAIAREALLRHDEWEAAIDAWTRPILQEPSYPDWLKQAALNELYYDSFGGVFWEAGCITRPGEFKGLHPEDHKYFALACPTQPFCEPLGLRHAASSHLLALWPEIERDVLITYADVILDCQTASVHDLGAPSGDPILAYNASPNAPPKAKDLPSLFILQAYAYYRATQDRAFLDYVWPACRKCYDALLAADTYGSALPGHQGDDAVTSPCRLHGISLLCGGLWVAALEALERLATARGDSLAATIRQLLPLARTNLDRRLWRGHLRYYAIDTHSRYPNALAAGALAGLRFTQANNLPPILPIERIHDHLRQVFLRCVKPLRDYRGDGVGDVGAINIVGPRGSPPRVTRSHEVSVAATYQLAATMYHVGRQRRDEGLMANALRTAEGAYYQTWVVAPGKPFWAFNTPQAWDADNPARARATQHIEPRAIWDLLLEIKDPFAGPPAKE